MHSGWQKILYCYQKLCKYMTYLQTQLIKCNIREDVIRMCNVRKTAEVLIIYFMLHFMHLYCVIFLSRPIINQFCMYAIKLLLSNILFYKVKFFY